MNISYTIILTAISTLLNVQSYAMKHTSLNNQSGFDFSLKGLPPELQVEIISFIPVQDATQALKQLNIIRATSTSFKNLVEDTSDYFLQDLFRKFSFSSVIEASLIMPAPVSKAQKFYKATVGKLTRSKNEISPEPRWASSFTRMLWQKAYSLNSFVMLSGEIQDSLHACKPDLYEKSVENKMKKIRKDMPLSLKKMVSTLSGQSLLQLLEIIGKHIVYRSHCSECEVEQELVNLLARRYHTLSKKKITRKKLPSLATHAGSLLLEYAIENKFSKLVKHLINLSCDL